LDAGKIIPASGDAVNTLRPEEARMDQRMAFLLI
jgi:hypothetical protein